MRNNKTKKRTSPPNADAKPGVKMPGKGNASRVRRRRASSGRKTKSLALICQRFFRSLYEITRTGQQIFNLNDTAKEMKVEKRRLYDLISVFESLKAIERSDMGIYKWMGLQKLPSLMHEFKECAVENHTYNKFEKAIKEVLKLVPLPDNKPSDIDGEGEQPTVQREKKNLLNYLTKELLMLLISAKEHDKIVTLDVASTMVMKNPEIQGYHPPGRNKCRRIYDVANILVAARLIRKTTSTLGTKKIPCFAYCGPDPKEGGSFNFFEYIDEHKLSPTKTNRVEREAFREEEEMLSDLLREKRSKNSGNSHSCNNETKQKTKRARTKATKPTNVLVNGNNKNELAIHVDEGASPLHLPSKRPQSQEIAISGPCSIQKPSRQQRSTRVASPATPNETSVLTIAPNTLPASEQLHGNITRVINDPNNIWMRFSPPIFTQQMGPADFSSHHFLPEFDWQQQNSDLLNYLRGIFAANSAGPSSFQQTSHQQRSTRVAAPATPSETSMQIIAPNTLPTNNQFNGNMPANNVRMRFPRVIFGEQLDPADRSSHRFLAAFDQQQFRGLINHLMEIFAANSANFNGARLS